MNLTHFIASLYKDDNIHHNPRIKHTLNFRFLDGFVPKPNTHFTLSQSLPYAQAYSQKQSSSSLLIYISGAQAPSKVTLLLLNPMLDAMLSILQSLREKNKSFYSLNTHTRQL